MRVDKKKPPFIQALILRNEFSSQPCQSSRAEAVVLQVSGFHTFGLMRSMLFAQVYVTKNECGFMMAG